MKVLSLYCGAGGIDEGLKQTGIKTTLAIDMEKDMIETIKLNHECETIVGKVGDYIESFNDFDIIVGGPPCPEFSRANIKRSFNMCEVDNFWYIINKCKPKYYLMENVQDVNKKLWGHNVLVNTANYGVPQKRLRRFFTNLPTPNPTHGEYETSNLFGEKVKKWVSVREALGLQPKTLLYDRTQSGFDKKEGKVRLYDTENPSCTISCGSKLYLVSDIRNKNPVFFDKHKPNNIEKPCKTINTGHASPDEMITNGEYCRELTNEEKAIIQGFPKEYQFFGSKTSVATQIGNAVPPPPIREFFKSVK